MMSTGRNVPGAPVVLIGGANLDILGRPKAAMVAGDSNPGRIRFAVGGVCRNIAENLSRLQVPVELITVLGNTPAGRMIEEHCIDAGIGMDYSLRLPGDASSSYMAITDHQGDMAWAISDMSAIGSLTPHHLEDRAELLSSVSLAVADANLPLDCLEYLTTAHPDLPLLVDPVSAAKAVKLIPYLGGIQTLKMNALEAEAITGIDITNRDDLRRTGTEFTDKGVGRCFITFGGELVYWKDGEKEGFFKPPSVSPVDTTGAGDAFSAGVVYGFIQNLSMEETLILAAAAARLTVECESAVNPDLNQAELEAAVGELRKRIR